MKRYGKVWKGPEHGASFHMESRCTTFLAHGSSLFTNPEALQLYHLDFFFFCRLHYVGMVA